MAKRLEFDIVTDPSKGIAGLKQFSSAAKKAMKDVDESMGDTTTSAQKVAKALSGMADELETEMKGAAKAADALGKALGPDIAGRADLTQIIGDLRKMGLSFDEITADADVLAGSLKQLDAVQVSGPVKGLQEMEQSTGRAKAGVDELGKSAGSSRSVLANMIGNSTQDLSALGGVAGSAGVAIGQMGEYMADAAGDGDKLGQIVSNFGKVAVPLAAIGLVTKVISDAFAENAKMAEENKKNVDDLFQAFEEGNSILSVFADTIRQTGELKFPGQGDVLDDLAKVKLSLEDFAALAALPQDDLEAWAAAQEKVLKGTPQYEAMKNVVFSLAQANVNAADAAKLHANTVAALRLDVAGVTRGFKAFMKAQTGVEDLPKTYDAVANAIIRMRQGMPATAHQLEAINVLIAAGVPPESIWAAGNDVVDQRATEMRDALNPVIDAMEQWRDDTIAAAADVSDSLGDITEQWSAMSDEVSKKSFQEALDQFDGLSELDLAQMRQDTVKSFDDVKEAIKTAAKEVKGWGKMDLTPDSFEELRGMPDQFAAITDAVSSMRGTIQTELKASFDTGGINEFSDKFDFFAGQVREQFTGLFTGMGLPKAQVDKQVQAILDDLGLLPKEKEIIIKLTRDQEAKNALDLFMSDIETIEKAEPTVDIRAKMAAGDIEGALDEINALRVLAGKEPIVLPTDVDRVGAQRAAADAATRAQNYLAQHPALISSQMTNPTGVGKVLKDTQTTLDNHPLTVTVKAALQKFTGSLLDSGGTAGPGGGIVGERRPEIVNGRYLITQPTVVPPGTRVTSGARTARILRHGRGRGLKRYDSGGVVSGGGVTVNFNGVGAIGNRFDLMRTVQRANLDKTRLLGQR